MICRRSRQTRKAVQYVSTIFSQNKACHVLMDKVGKSGDERPRHRMGFNKRCLFSQSNNWAFLSIIHRSTIHFNPDKDYSRKATRSLMYS